MMADLVTGRVDFGLAYYTVANGFFAENKLKALAVDAGARLSVLPDVPTMTEAGLGHIKVASWFALAAPAGTPPQLVEKIRDEFIKASKDPDLQRRLDGNGTPIHTSTPEEMGKLLADEVVAMKQLVDQLGLKQ
jgi:tripartite-type tricarboxylate transporter receptor subunit TctC